MFAVEGGFAERARLLPRCPVVSVTGVLAIAVTALFWAGTDIEVLFETPAAAGSEPWRLLTSALPHADILHLAFNLYWLVLLGTTVETSFRPLRTLGVFVLLAAASGAWQLAASGGGIGLSGIGYGLFGMLWVLARTDPRFHGAVDRGMVELFVGWFVLCLVLTFTGFWQVANAAHAAGAVAGALLGAAASRGVRRRAAFGAAAVLFLAAAIGWIRIGAPGVPAGAEVAGRGYEALVASRYAEAEALFRTAAERGPTVAWYRYNLGVALERQSRWNEACEAFQEASRLDPGNAEYRKTADELEAWLLANQKR